LPRDQAVSGDRARRSPGGSTGKISPPVAVGLHCRLIGRSGRIAALERFLDHVMAHDDVWICRRNAIAQHWIVEQPAGEGPLS